MEPSPSLFLVPALLLPLSGCSGGSSHAGAEPSARDEAAVALADDDAALSSSPDSEPDGCTGLVRFVNASTAPVDVYLHGDPRRIFAGAYGTVTHYARLPAHTVRFDVRPAGARASTRPVYVSGPVNVTPNARATLAAAGSLGAPSDTLRLQYLPEAFAPPAVGTTRVRFVHDALSTPFASIDVGDDGTIEVASLPAFTASAAQGVATPAGQNLRFALYASASPTGPRTRAASFTIPVDPQRGREIFVFATGDRTKLPRAAEGLRALVVGRGASVARVKADPSLYVLNVVTEERVIDVEIEGALRATGLGFAALSTPVAVPPSEAGYALALSSAGTPNGIATTGPVLAGERYLVVATGSGRAENEPSAIVVKTYREGFGVGGANARLRALHASPDAPPLAFGNAATPNTFAAVAGLGTIGFLEASDELGAAWDDAPLNPVFQSADDTDDRTPFAAGRLERSDRAFLVAAGAYLPRAMGERELQLVLIRAASDGAWSASNLLRDF